MSPSNWSVLHQLSIEERLEHLYEGVVFLDEGRGRSVQGEDQGDDEGGSDHEAFQAHERRPPPRSRRRRTAPVHHPRTGPGSVPKKTTTYENMKTMILNLDVVSVTLLTN